MMNSKVMNIGADNDAELVAASLSGDRAAFGRIVSRYQSLVCSVTYSATGNLTLSEDVAQETFVTAWRQLAELREPAKLRAWLCGIARNLLHNTLRRLGREPSQSGETLDAAAELSSPEEAPGAQTIRREEEAILWQALERIPELYRAPLILFYREGRSVEQTAALLDLSEDVVRQRLTRGRKQLADEVTAFVEGTLRRSAPGPAFVPGVLAALPPLAIPGAIAAAGTTAKGGAAAKAAGVGTFVSTVILSPLLILLGNYASYRVSLEAAGSEEERVRIRKFYRRITLWALAMVVIFPAAIIWRQPLARLHNLLPLGLAAGIVVLSTAAIFSTVIAAMKRQRLAARAAASGRPLAAVPEVPPVWEYRSAMRCLGWPLVHIRIGRGMAGSTKPVKAWIAVGDFAVGRFAAFGGLAIAPVSVGGLAFGLLPLGAMALGLAPMGACAIGVLSWGGVAAGWQAFGGFALGWQWALGGVAVARDFALGDLAYAAQANTDVARQFLDTSRFFRWTQAAAPYAALINLLWVTPLLVWWRILSRHPRKGR